jgi:hypothetical protein
MRCAILLLSACLAAVEAVPTPAVAAPPLDAGHAGFAPVLALAVRADGVDYAALRADRAGLDRYRAQLAQAAMPTDRAEILALFINAYNACTLALVIDRLPADRTAWPRWSNRGAGIGGASPWQAYSYEVAGRRYTLDEMEHAVLRPLGEPRIHVAINCASRSCPPLAAEPFRAATLDAQLEAAARAFVASPHHLRLEDGGLRTNPLLEWFAADFAAGGGVRAFLAARAPQGPLATALAGATPMRFFAYDWSLNLAEAP